MKALLEELKTIDRACYDEIWAWALWLEDPDFGEYEPNDPNYLKHRDDVIQGACQRAIAAYRGKHFTEDRFYEVSCDDIGIYQAKIFNRLGLMAVETCDSPAKAILTAYIAARKAQP